jgi:signal peptide peptidase SppA
MKLLDILTSPWAIIPSKLEEISNIYATHLRGEKIDIAGVEARLGRPLANERQPYQVTDGVAQINVDGPLAKRMNMFMQVSGGTSMELLASDLRAALADAEVKAVLLIIDSPGGTVDGTEDLARTVLAARDGGKPVVAWVDGMMASAAYWIGAAADAIYIGASTDTVGSIGVAMQHIDRSAADKMDGIKRTDIYAGQYKRIASDTAPLTKEGRAYLQDMVDTQYSIFVEAVAQARGIDTDTVLADMADGRIFIGQQAINAGLVDGVSTRAALVADLAAGRYRPQRMQMAAGAATTRAWQPAAAAAGAGDRATPFISAAYGSPLATPAIHQKGDPMDLATLKKDHPELAASIAAEAAAAERARIQGVLGVALPGHEALVEDMAFDGRTSPGDAALAVNTAERTALKTAGATLRAERPAAVVGASLGDPLAAAAAAAAEKQAEPTGTVEERARTTWDRDASLRNEFVSVESFTSWFKANDRGAIKVLGARAA